MSHEQAASPGRRIDPPPPGGSSWMDRGILLLLGVTLLAFSLHRIISYDIWWQMKTGAWLLAEGFPRTDPFSYGFPGQAWIELRWLHCLLVHVLARSLGLNALILGKCLLLLMVFWILHRIPPVGHQWAGNMGLLVFVCLGYARFRVRPELFSFLFLSILLLVLERYRRGGSARWLLILPLQQIFWSNAHTLAVLGPVVLWIVLIADGIQSGSRRFLPLLRGDPHVLWGRRWLRLLLVALATSLGLLATPYHVQGALFPLTLMNQIKMGGVVGRVVTEFRSPLEEPEVGFFLISYAAGALVSGASFLLRLRRLSLSRLTLWAAFLTVSLMARRNITLLGITGGAILALNLRDWASSARPRALRAMAWTSRAVILPLVLTLPLLLVTDAFWRAENAEQSFGLGLQERLFPIKAMAFVRQQGLPEPVFGSLGDGGYFLYLGGPRSVFVDGRLEVYGRHLIPAIRTTQLGENLLQHLRRRRIHTAVLRNQGMEPAIGILAAQREWWAVYFDERHVVFVQETPHTRARLRQLRIDWRQPVSQGVQVPPELRPRIWPGPGWPRVPDTSGWLGTGALMLRMGNLQAARENYRRAVELRPNETMGCLHLGMLEHALGRESEAERLFQRIDRSLLERKSVLMVRAQIEYLAGNQSRAERFRDRALAMN